MSLPDEYEKIAALTRQMLEAARLLDWDTLTSLDASRDRLFATLPGKLPPMLPDDSVRIAAAIKEILASHTEIADRAAPWMEQTARLLSAFERANGAPPPLPPTDTP